MLLLVKGDRGREDCGVVVVVFGVFGKVHMNRIRGLCRRKRRKAPTCSTGSVMAR